VPAGVDHRVSSRPLYCTDTLNSVSLIPCLGQASGGATMSEEAWDLVLGDIFAALDRDAAAEGQLIAIAPRLSDEQILRAWAYLAHDDATRWRARSALAHEALRRVVGRAERDGRGTAAVQQLAATLAGSRSTAQFWTSRTGRPRLQSRS